MIVGCRCRYLRCRLGNISWQMSRSQLDEKHQHRPAYYIQFYWLHSVYCQSTPPAPTIGIIMSHIFKAESYLLHSEIFNTALPPPTSEKIHNLWTCKCDPNKRYSTLLLCKSQCVHKRLQVSISHLCDCWIWDSDWSKWFSMSQSMHEGPASSNEAFSEHRENLHWQPWINVHHSTHWKNRGGISVIRIFGANIWTC